MPAGVPEKPSLEGIADKWEPFYREPLVHQRFVAWLRPVPADAELVT